jgi:hypothetical protein
MKKISIFLVFVSISPAWDIAYSQVSLGNIAITGVAIIDANHKTPLTHQTIHIKNEIISDIFADGSKAIADSFSVMPLQKEKSFPFKNIHANNTYNCSPYAKSRKLYRHLPNRDAFKSYFSKPVNKESKW